MNAEVATQNAERSLTKGAIDAQTNDNETAGLIGEQVVAQSASGITLSGKSQILTRAAARRVGAQDTANIINNSQVDAYGHKVEAANFKAEAKSAKISGVLGLVGSLAAAGGQLAEMKASKSASASMIGGSTSVANPSRYVPKPIEKPYSLKRYQATQRLTQAARNGF